MFEGVFVHKFYRPILLMLILQVGAMQTASASLRGAYELLVSCFEQHKGVPGNAIAAAMASCVDRSNWDLYLSWDESDLTPDDRFHRFLYRTAVGITILAASGIVPMMVGYARLSIAGSMNSMRDERRQ